jgi:hypothetical protein
VKEGWRASEEGWRASGKGGGQVSIKCLLQQSQLSIPLHCIDYFAAPSI